MNKDHFDYFLTGATGLVGSHVLFELLLKLQTNNHDSKIYLLVRGMDQLTPDERIRKILKSEIAPRYIQEIPFQKLINRIEIINSDITDENLDQKLRILKNKQLLVIHSAASTNLAATESAIKQVQKVNIGGTKNLLNGLSDAIITKFVFVGTAYACGIQTELIPHSFLSLKNRKFRNPYEESKARSEEIVDDFCKTNNIKLQILRPAIICGRLIDAPLYATLKFDVFYSVVHFFYKKREMLGDNKFRIYINQESTLNVVPVDFVAKVICDAINDNSISELNIIDPKSLVFTESIRIMMSYLNIDNYEFVSELPENMNRTEELYYKLIEKIYGSYMNSPAQCYDANMIMPFYKKYSYSEILKSAKGLLDFAVEKDFNSDY